MFAQPPLSTQGLVSPRPALCDPINVFEGCISQIMLSTPVLLHFWKSQLLVEGCHVKVVHFLSPEVQGHFLVRKNMVPQVGSAVMNAPVAFGSGVH